MNSKAQQQERNVRVPSRAVRQWEHTRAVVHNLQEHQARSWEDATLSPTFNSPFCTPFPATSFANFMDPSEHSSLLLLTSAYWRPQVEAPAFSANLHSLRLCQRYWDMTNGSWNQAEIHLYHSFSCVIVPACNIPSSIMQAKKCKKFSVEKTTTSTCLKRNPKQNSRIKE